MNLIGMLCQNLTRMILERKLVKKYKKEIIQKPKEQSDFEYRAVLFIRYLSFGVALETIND